MGLSIHYSAHFAEMGRLDEFIREISDLAKDLDWRCTEIHQKDIHGVVISPAHCEPLWLCFTGSGEAVNPQTLEYMKGDDRAYSIIHVKTQYAGPDTHMALIRLLKYISAKYFRKIELLDEGDYWETGDENILIARFEKYNEALETVAGALQDFRIRPGEPTGSIARRIEELLNKKFGGYGG